MSKKQSYMLSQIDPFLGKAMAISLGDYSLAFILLLDVFKQRKEAARIYIINTDKQVKQFIKSCDSKIKNILLLED